MSDSILSDRLASLQLQQPSNKPIETTSKEQEGKGLVDPTSPQALRAGLGKLYKLPIEIVEEIIGELDVRDILPVTLVSHAMNFLALPCMVNDIDLARDRKKLAGQATLIDRLYSIGRLRAVSLTISHVDAKDRALLRRVQAQVAHTVQHLTLDQKLVQDNVSSFPPTPRLASLSVGLSVLLGSPDLARLLHPSTSSLESFYASGPPGLVQPQSTRDLFGLAPLPLGKLLASQPKLRDFTVLAGYPHTPLHAVTFCHPSMVQYPGLRTLVLAGQVMVEPKEAASLLKHTPNLEKLIIALAGPFMPPFTSGPPPELRKLKYLGGTVMGALSLGSAVATSHQLDTLAFNGNVLDEDIQEYGGWLSNIRVRELSWSLTDAEGTAGPRAVAALEVASAMLPELEHLRIHDTVRLRVASTKYLRELGGVLSPHAHRLQSIKMVQSTIKMSPSKRLDAVTELFARLPALERVSIITTGYPQGDSDGTFFWRANEGGGCVREQLSSWEVLHEISENIEVVGGDTNEMYRLLPGNR